ncbi:MAG: outer membrane beta-barrel protein [Deferribacterales bacterium]|jgi:predicted negative regulator of RcsB-dependent stress response
MRLSYNYTKILTVLLTVFCLTSAYAYDYPVVGEFNSNYEKVFSNIKEGSCGSMDASLKQLEEAEGISGNIYKAICYFENNDSAAAMKTLDDMILLQEFDEVLYVVQTQMDKGNSASGLKKYRGLAYYNVGALDPALTDLESYVSETQDEDVTYVITDIYITKRDFASASASIEKSPVKEARYNYRKGRIALRSGNVNTALEYLRTIKPENTRVYPSAKMLIGEICAGSKRFNCAEKEYAEAAKSEDYSDMAKEKAAKLEERKKLFSGFMSVGLQYDSNVTSVDENEVPGASEVSSARIYGLADLRVNFYPSFAESISIGTTHYGTSNENYHDYDMSTHKVYVMMKKSYDDFEFTLPKISVGVTYFGGEKYSTSVTGEMSGTYKMDTWSFTVPLKVARYNFTDEDSQEYSKDGYKYEGGLTVSKRFLDIYTAKVKAVIAHDDVDGEYKVKNDKTIGASISARYFEKLIPTFAVDYSKYDYSNIDRDDDFVSVSLKAVYVFTPNIFFGGGVTYTSTDSSEDAYDYNKTVTDLSVSYTF